MVNRGSGGKKAPLLLNLQVEEIEFSNYIDHRGALEDLQTIKVKICAMNDASSRYMHMAEIREMSMTKSSPRTRIFKSREPECICDCLWRRRHDDLGHRGVDQG